MSSSPKRNRRAITALTTPAAAAALLCLCGGAMATPVYTHVNAPHVGEESHAQILGTIFGGNWSTMGTNDYAAGSMTAVRVADSGIGLPVALGGSGAGVEDQAWGGGPVLVTSWTKYDADTAVFGWLDDSQGGNPSFQSIFTASTWNAQAIVPTSSNFRWALFNPNIGRVLTSRISDNRGTGSFQGTDQMVTYFVAGQDGAPSQWVLMWEERLGNSDYDYNDVVVTITTAVPAPSVGVAGLMGSALLAGRRRRKV